MSHKWITYFEAAIPSCPGRSGARSVGGGKGVFQWPADAGQRPGRLVYCQSIDICRYLRRHVFRSTPVYAHLFYTKLLNSLELLSFDPLFSGKSPSVLQRGRRPAVAPARHRQGGGRPRGAKFEAFYCGTHMRFSTMALSHKWITYLEALIPCVGNRGALVVRRPRQGFFSASICANCSQLAPMYGCLCPFILTTSLILFGLCEFVPLFTRARRCRTALPHGIDKAQGGRC